jgi:hypothetical protein
MNIVCSWKDKDCWAKEWGISNMNGRIYNRSFSVQQKTDFCLLWERLKYVGEWRKKIRFEKLPSTQLKKIGKYIGFLYINGQCKAPIKA